MNYKAHRKELLQDKAIKTEHDKLLPEYELAKSIIQVEAKEENDSEKTLLNFSGE